MKTFTYEELIQALTQIETTLAELSTTINKDDRPTATANLKAYRRAAASLKNLYIRFLDAKNQPINKNT